MIVSCLAAVACAPGFVSFATTQKKRLRTNPTHSGEDEGEPGVLSIASRVQQVQSAVREADPRQRRLVEVTKITEESPGVLSVYLSSVDDTELPSFRPGQHLIVECPLTGSAMTSRCYSLSNGPKQKPWRITVRRNERGSDTESVSRWIHRELRVGDRLRVRGPRGSFTLDKAVDTKPVVFIAAGVGITPMASMLYDELSYPRARAKWLFYQVRTWGTAPLLHELVAAIERSQVCNAWIAASQDVTPQESPLKRVRLVSGKLDPSMIVETIGTTDACIFLCGPDVWMQQMRQRFVASGVPDGQIHDEAFGGTEAPVSDSNSPSPAVTVDETVFDVTFEATGKSATYSNKNGNLLSLAKQHSVVIPASCRTGQCGTCAVKLLRGSVKYVRPPSAEVMEDEILPCICIPTSDISVQV
jgi:ferredoxin-NADP reductase